MALFTVPGISIPRFAGVFVCGCCIFFPILTLSLASQKLPTDPPLKIRTDKDHSKKELLISLSVSALFVTWVLFMACFKLIRFRIRRNSKQNDVEKELAKTHVTDLSVSQFESDSVICFKNSVQRFIWEEIERLTKNFCSVIGEGGFSTVYQGYFSDSTLGALKIHRNSERLSRVFKQELEILLQIRHENIVKLIGFCDEQEGGALLFEFIPNGNLHEKLHDRSGNSLPWNQRMSIAFQLAGAIEYLHDCCNLQIVHADIKSSNVLLDDQFNCKLCDFGFAKMGFSSTILPSPTMMGSPGYVDPHYLRTGIVSKKNDVYSFGVLVLELITGIEAFCSEREQLLTSIARPLLKDSKKITEMVDHRLAEKFDVEEAILMASISARCIGEQASLRPSMNEILKIMKEKIPSVFVAGKFKENGKVEEYL